MLLGKNAVYFVQNSSVVLFVSVSFISLAQADSIQGIRTQCFTNLEGLINNKQAADLCRRATPYTSKCFIQTQTLMGNARAIELCRMATPYTNQCLTETRKAVNESAAINLCQSATETTSKCFRQIQTALGNTEALKRCIPSPEDKLDVCSQSILFDPLSSQRNKISESVALKYCKANSDSLSQPDQELVPGDRPDQPRPTPQTLPKRPRPQE